MGAERHTATAMYADKGLAGVVQVDGIHRAGLGALPAADAQAFLYFDAATLALGKGARGAERGTGRRIAGQAANGREAGGQAAGGLDADAGSQPGKVVVHKPGAG